MQQVQSKPNQQNGGLIYVNFTPEPIMTIDQLSQYIIYLIQIYQYAVNNNVLRIALNNDK